MESSSTPTTKLSLQEHLRQEIEVARKEEERWRRKRIFLERTFSELQSVDIISEENGVVRLSPIVVPQESHNNKEIIVRILQEHKKALKIKEIAAYAQEKNLIHSPKGSAGIYSIVQTVLGRNQKIFMKLGRGLWDLRDRHIGVAPERASAQGSYGAVEIYPPNNTLAPTSGPYTTKSTGDAIEDVFHKREGTLSVDQIQEILLQGGWQSTAENKKQTIASVLSRDDRFEYVPNHGYRLKIKPNTNVAA